MTFGADGVTTERVTNPDAETVSDVVGANIRDIRKRHGWKVADLAARCQQLGGDGEALTAAVIENIEHGRRHGGDRRTRFVTVDELLTIAEALSVPPSALMPELAEGPGDIPVLFGLDDMAAGLRAALGSVDELKARLAKREGDG
jgi:transcriptional regulator with XRE-family HTH domain